MFVNLAATFSKRIRDWKLIIRDSKNCKIQILKKCLKNRTFALSLSCRLAHFGKCVFVVVF